MITEHDVSVDGRILHVHDSGPVEGPQDRGALVWQTGSPQTGALLAPLLQATSRRGMRLVSYARPGYPGSTRQPGRRVADAAADVDAIADAIGLGRFAAMGASGGGPHSLAAAALLDGRVTAAVTLAGIAPLVVSDPDASRAPLSEDDWFSGMRAPGGLRAAAAGLGVRELFAETDDFDPESFVAADYATLDGDWSVLGDDSQRAGAEGPFGLVDDDVAFATDWGVDLGAVAVPVLVVQGGLDRVVPEAHGRWLLDACGSELWLRPGAGHVSILEAVPVALDWLLAR